MIYVTEKIEIFSLKNFGKNQSFEFEDLQIFSAFVVFWGLSTTKECLKVFGQHGKQVFRGV